eukprot:6178185-Pleurochrysis_carterae.AAC.1
MSCTAKGGAAENDIWRCLCRRWRDVSHLGVGFPRDSLSHLSSRTMRPMIEAMFEVHLCAHEHPALACPPVDELRLEQFVALLRLRDSRHGLSFRPTKYHRQDKKGDLPPNACQNVRRNLLSHRLRLPHG